jgi:NADPH-dependent 2,4-dienoyl-CoA reductase/sulfur reductase-like enzyme
MTKRRILVIGGLAAGPSAASKAVRTNPQAEVVLFEAGETVSYGICETPYAIGGIVPDEESLVVNTPEKLQSSRGFAVRTLNVVEAIQPSRHTISVRDLRSRDLREEPYDKLIIATGAQAKRLGLEGESERNVFHLRTRDDARAILGALATESPKRALMVGGGFLGMEICEALRMRGLEVTVLQDQRLPMPTLEQEARDRILEELRANGVHFLGGVKLEGFGVRSGTVRHAFTDKGSYETDLVIVAVGICPVTALAKGARIRLGPTGAIATDGRMQTSSDDVYAAGDCCEVKNAVTGKPMYLPLATVASRTGWVAGENAAGGRALFKGVVRAVALRVFGLEVAHVGLSSAEARGAGYQVITQSVVGRSLPDPMPGGGPVTVVLVADKSSQRLLGANVFGVAGAAARANVLSAAIRQKMTVEEVGQLDMIYAPPLAPLWDPLVVAAHQSRKKF